VIARLRPFVILFFAALAFAVIQPRIAAAHILDHGKTVFFHNVTIGPDDVVDGDLTVVFGDARVAGHVRGDVNTLFGKCVIEDGAEIDGQANCVTADAARAIAPWFLNSAAFDKFAYQDKHLLAKFGASAIVLLVFLLFPMRMRLALDSVERHPGLAAFVGIVAVIAMIPLAILLAITIVGIPLIVLEFAAIFVGIWLGTGAIALLVGRRLTELVLPRTTPSPLWALVLGLVVVSAAETVPYVGWAVTALVWLVGLGASILAFLGSAPVAAAMRRAGIGGPPMPTRQI
jgi:hypothetical protein